MCSIFSSFPVYILTFPEDYHIYNDNSGRLKKYFKMEYFFPNLYQTPTLKYILIKSTHQAIPRNCHLNDEHAQETYSLKKHPLLE